MKTSLFIITFILYLNTYAQKAIIIDTAIGIGKTCEESKLNAFVNSLNKISGTYINASTKISNEEIIANNITSITQGGIITNPRIYKACYTNKDDLKESVWILSITSDGISKLIKSINNTISINGAFISIEMEKIKKNEQSETKAVENILDFITDQFNNSFEYEISNLDNSFKIVKENVEIPIKISIKNNKNIEYARDYLINNIEKVALDQTSINFINKYYKDKKFYNISINNKVYSFLKKETIDKILNFYKNYFKISNVYKIENDCNDKLNFIEQSKTKTYNEENIYMGYEGEEIQKINGYIILRKEEIFKVNNIIISSVDNPKNKSRKMESNKYSDTNPFEFAELKNTISNKLNFISNSTESGSLNFEWNFKFDSDGRIDKNYITQSKQKKNEIYYDQIKKILETYELNPSLKCNGFIESTDTIKVALTWETKYKTYLYESNSDKDDLQSWFLSKKLPYGKYTIKIKEISFNNRTFQNIFVNDLNAVGSEAVIQSVFIPGSGIKKASYGQQTGKSQFWGVFIPFTLSAATYLASSTSYNNYLNEPTDDKFQIANNLNKASIIFEGWGIFNYIKQIFTTTKIVKFNIADKGKILELVDKGENIIKLENITF